PGGGDLRCAYHWIPPARAMERRSRPPPCRCCPPRLGHGDIGEGPQFWRAGVRRLPRHRSGIGPALAHGLGGGMRKLLAAAIVVLLAAAGGFLYLKQGAKPVTVDAAV